MEKTGQFTDKSALWSKVYNSEGEELPTEEQPLAEKCSKCRNIKPADSGKKDASKQSD